MPTTRKPKTRADYAIWRARCILDWMQAAFDGTGDYPAEYLAGQMALEMRILLTPRQQQSKATQTTKEAR